MACANISIKKRTCFKAGSSSGAGGFRTHVQTKDPIIFYMFIIILFSKEDRRDDSNTSSYLVTSRLFNQEINKSILNLLCLR